MSIVKKIFGTKSTRQIKKLSGILDEIYMFADSVKRMSDIELRSKTMEFQSKIKSGVSLDEILPEAYAVCAEASLRTIGMYPYRVQFIGGIVLHQGRIAEMKTGEGKTLVAALPAYLNALAGDGVHIVTVNDYLAKRDSEWIGKIYKFLGLSVGLIYPGQSIEDKRIAYNSDITYGTGSEFGFDYLRDNMTIYRDNLVQRGHIFAIVDEVDSILIDEARTPMIIAGESYKPSRVYIEANEFASILKYDVQGHVDGKMEENPNSEYDAIVDEACRSVTLTAKGIRKAEKKFHLDNLGSIDNSDIMGYIRQAIKAHGLMRRDVDYIIEDGKVVIVDSYTGRMVPGKRYNGGLHQAIEAKEGVLIENENRTMASISIQNYFRMYKKLSGMTGTAMTEQDEFAEIYNLDVVEIPTNIPMIRKDHSDVVYRNKRGKINAIIKRVQQCHEKGQPVLIGTISVESSEEISRKLKKLKLFHNVLNAKNYAREADIVAQAGRKGAITVATNMAGRGTDIILGGNIEALIIDRLLSEGYDKESILSALYRNKVHGLDGTEISKRVANLEQELKRQIETEAAEVRSLGGLFIIGTERHDARRIDNQLRGRSGRQGDPGESQFYLSFEDDVMRKFGSDRILPVLESLNMDEDTPINNKALSSMIEQAQKKVESQNFQVRKSLIEYDDILNKQREIIYQQRRQVLDGDDISSQIRDMIDKVAHRLVTEMDETKVVTAQVENIVNRLMTILPDSLETKESLLARFNAKASRDEYYSMVLSLLNSHYDLLVSNFTSVIREVERVTLLFIVDKSWAMHLDLVEDVRRSTQLQAYGMVQPIDAFRKQVSEYFEQLVEDIQLDTVRKLFHLHLD